MRHRYKSTLKMDTWYQSKDNIIRNLLTSLVKSGFITTTPQRWKILKAQADKFFSSLVSLFSKYQDEKDVRREAIRIVKTVIFTEDEGKKVINDLLPRFKQEWRTSWFVSDYKLWQRVWDWAEKIMIKIN